MSQGWIGVDFDRTLVFYDRWRGAGHVGTPILPMMNRVKIWLADGKDVRIFTARVYSDGTPERVKETYRARMAIEAFCLEHFGKILPVTCQKDFDCVSIYDDRAVQVEPNTGILIEEELAQYKDAIKANYMAWMIERLDTSQWLAPSKLRSGFIWTSDPNVALHFGRKIDAERLAERTVPTANESIEYRVTDHQWLGPRSEME